MPGRNDPCPCGSGKKYKRCCASKGEESHGAALSPKFRFEPGSYGGPGGFMPSIACLKQIRPAEWEYHFVLVRPKDVHAEEAAAVGAAVQDLDSAFAARGAGAGDVAVAHTLKSAGYVSVNGFQVVGA